MGSSEGTAAAAATAGPTAAPGTAVSAGSPPSCEGLSASAPRRTGEEGPRGPGESSGPLAAAPLKDLEDEVKISCLMNAHYHAAREAFLDTVHRWFMFGVVVFGAAALVDILPPESTWLKGVLSAGAASLGALDLTFDLSNRARAHAMMKRRYYEVLADLRERRKTVDEVRVCLDRFSADEEPAYRVLLLACWNAAQKSVYGDTAKALKISKVALAFKNLLRRPTYSCGKAEPATV